MGSCSLSCRISTQSYGWFVWCSNPAYSPRICLNKPQIETRLWKFTNQHSSIVLFEKECYGIIQWYIICAHHCRLSLECHYASNTGNSIVCLKVFQGAIEENKSQCCTDPLWGEFTSAILFTNCRTNKIATISFADDIFKSIFCNKHHWIMIDLSMKISMWVRFTISRHWLRHWLGIIWRKAITPVPWTTVGHVHPFL